jgi:hypothetical glycosyl hydrolase
LLQQTFLHDDPRFADAVKQANFHYYEPKTLHDSSLSIATHSILANDIGEFDLAYSLFKKACEVDLGPLMNTSDDGIHAASIGGIWKVAVFGFAGLRLKDGKLCINPKLPKLWRQMEFTIHWKGQPITIFLSTSSISLKAENKVKVAFEIYGKTYEFDDFINIDFNSIK